MKVLEAALADAAKTGARMLSGETVFTLYDTFGFPLDLTADLCRERGFTLDQAGFEAAMDKQRERAGAASGFKGGEALPYSGAKTVFDGYKTLSTEGRVTALFHNGAAVDSLTAGQEGIVILDRTPFYAESGGQVGDRGELTKSGVCLTLFAVHDAQKVQADVVGHHGEVKSGSIRVGDIVAAQVDVHTRVRTALTHADTIQMHAAL